MGPDEESPAARPEGTGRKRRVLLVGGAAVVLLAGGGAALTQVSTSAGGASADEDDAVELATATVDRRTLTEGTELDGTVGYGDVDPVGLVAQGTVTSLPRIGSVVRRGETLVEVDGRPVPLLYGDRPMWRPLGPDADDGDDIEQLETNLVALGIVTGDELTVDGDWTGVTTAAVREWQEARGVDVTGTLEPGDLVFLPGAARVAEHPLPVGSPVGEEVLKVTGTERMVTVDLEADRRSLVEEGQEVDVELSDGTQVSGTVASVADVATSPDSGSDPDGSGDPGSDGDGTATVDVVIELDDEEAEDAELLDQSPVTVHVVTSAAEDVLTVPVEALLALAEGGYAVELEQGDGTTELIPVELGASASGRVEITGDVAEGDEVVVPSD